ncbi:transposase [Patescibacteria group bacterium]|nr:MAG: transposase [Patescibacteria group bacterium]
MSTDMRGIHQQSLFGRQIMLSVMVSEESRYRVLANTLPWLAMAGVANHYRAMKIDIDNGRRLNLRLHLGAYVSQNMNGWTDRQTEEMVRYHAGVRILCGQEEDTDTLDRTSIEDFRNTLGSEGAEQINQIIVKYACGAGFTGSELCASDTTVQESPIAYPTEVGHMKNISEKLLGIGRKLKNRIAQKIEVLSNKAQGVFTKIRLFTRGKQEEVLAKKKVLSQKLHRIVKSMATLVKGSLKNLNGKTKAKALDQILFYEHMLGQITQWLKTGFHPKEKILSLWEKSARAISKGKVGRSAEFGRRWIITRLLGGYVIGSPCQRLGADADTAICDEVMMGFLNTFGELPEAFVYDRGADSEKNTKFLEDLGVENICIFPKGQKKMNVSSEVLAMARRERSLTEESIASIKHPKYGFTKPRAKSTESCILKGHTAILGLNINNLFRDISQAWDMRLEIT